MMTTTLDTLKLAEKFTIAGFEEKKARALAETFGNLANEQLVTKEYFDFKLKNELEKLELRLTIKTTVVVTAVITFFKLVEGFLRG
ncbi:MAG: hypothetical protein HY564_00295 [Candidatus Jacksonbacteria bacterium]|nr:hypothetical protein [Candidatus Jacksonbacteria bacterium]